jgi:hypothetical protein
MPIRVISGQSAARIRFDSYHSLLFDSFESEIEAEEGDIRKKYQNQLKFSRIKTLYRV